MISDDLVPASVTAQVGSWSRFTFSWVMSRSKRPRNIWGATNGYARLGRIKSGSSHGLSRGNGLVSILLALWHELLRNVETSVRRSSNTDSDVSVVHVQDIPSMILLKLRLIHESRLSLAHAATIGDIFPGRAPLNSRHRKELRGRSPVRALMTEESIAGHFLRVHPGHCCQSVVPLKRRCAAFGFVRVRPICAVAID